MAFGPGDVDSRSTLAYPPRLACCRQGSVAEMTLEQSFEAHFSAVTSRAQAPARLSGAYGDQEWPKGRGASSRQGPQALDRLNSGPETVGLTQRDPLKIERLRRRSEFLAVAKGRFAPRGAVGIQGLARQDGSAVTRVGFTATRKIGGAVVRNRAKRRLREAAQRLLPLYGRAGCDYVFIARAGTPSRPWERLLDDVKNALTSLAVQLNPPADAAKPSALTEPPLLSSPPR